MLVSTHHRGVDLRVPVDILLGLSQGDDPLLEPRPRTILGPPPKPQMRGTPRPVPLRHVPPRRTGPLDPADPVDHLTVIPPPTTTSALLRQQRLQNRPLPVGQIETRHDQYNEPPPRSESHALADGPNWITLADPAGHPFDLCQADGVGPVMRLFAVTIDAPDASALARFYADLTGTEVTYDGPEGALVVGGGKEPDVPAGQRLQSASLAGSGAPQQAHLDLLVDDLDTGAARALELGARLLSAGDERFRVFTDPAGHPFCLIR